MVRSFIFFSVFVVLIGAGLAIAGWPRAHADTQNFANDSKLMAAYARVHEGMPASGLAKLGFDPARAKHLSALALMEYFTPKDTYEFDTLAPVIQSCFQNRQDCTAYIFPVAESKAQVLLLVEGGRVMWKNLSGVSYSQRGRVGKMASALREN